MTAVIRFALAILQAWIMMHSSISAVLIAPHAVLIIYTSSSRTDSAMRTEVSPTPLRVTSAFETGKPILQDETAVKGLEREVMGYKRRTCERLVQLVQDG